MSGKVNIFSDQWIDLVFEGRFGLYGGAYDMRKSSSSRHGKALIYAVSLVALSVIGPILVTTIQNLTKKEVDTTVRVLDNLKLEQPKQDLPKPIAPPPPPVRSTIKFVPPVIKKDEQVNEEPPQIVEQIVESKTAISTVDVKGTTDAPEVPPAVTQVAETEEIFSVVEQMPEFEGGEKALYAFINANIRYPAIALENGVQGRVIVRFAVNSNGHIEQVSVLRGIGGGCDEEAIRIVKRMPSWKPGKQGGRSVSVWYTLPIMFALQQ